MKLLDRAGYRADDFSRAGGEGHPLVSLATLAETLATHNAPIGVDLANTVQVADIQPHLNRIALIAIAFPSFSDGRGFSLARRLRRAGFTGRLRATGPLIADQFAYALACGFDEIELPEASAERQPHPQWTKAAAAMSATYQRGYPAGGNILDQRRAARRDGRNG